MDNQNEKIVEYQVQVGKIIYGKSKKEINILPDIDKSYKYINENNLNIDQKITTIEDEILNKNIIALISKDKINQKIFCDNLNNQEFISLEELNKQFSYSYYYSDIDYINDQIEENYSDNIEKIKNNIKKQVTKCINDNNPNLYIHFKYNELMYYPTDKFADLQNGINESLSDFYSYTFTYTNQYIYLYN